MSGLAVPDEKLPTGTKRLKIAFCVHRMPAQGLGGTEVDAYNAAKYLARRGHEVHVITEAYHGKSWVEKTDGFYVHWLRPLNVKWLRSRLHSIMVAYEIRRINPDLVHWQVITRARNVFIIKLVLRKPLVIWCQGTDIFQWKGLIYDVRRWWNYAFADKIIGITDYMRRVIQSDCKTQVAYVPPATEINDSVMESQTRLACRHRLRITESEKVVLFVGRLIPSKGVNYLLHAFATLHHSHPQARLYIIGDGIERSNLETLSRQLELQSAVVFVGAVPHAQVLDYMAAADFLVLPTLSEGFPTVFPEAMAAGLPIITSRVCGLEEIVVDGMNGFTVSPCKPEALAEKMALLLDNDALRARIARYNIFAARSYSCEAVAEKLEAVYYSVLNGKMKTGNPMMNC